MRRLLSRLLHRQDGVAMPVVLGSLTVVTGIAVTTFAVAVESNHSSARDRDSKMALAAAEAGLQMAALKITEVKPNEGQCVTTAAVAPGEDGECPSTGALPMGNGATYDYVVSTPAGATCTTVPGFSVTAGVDRCITSIGEVNGVKRRLQMRYAYVPPFMPWGSAGLVGKEKVEIGENKTINSPIGTNGIVDVGNNSQLYGGVFLGQDENGSSTDFGNNVVNHNGTTNVPEWKFPTLNWNPVRTTGGNDNALLTGIPGWNASTMTLTPSNGQVITFPAVADGEATFRMCQMDVTANNVDIRVAAGQKVRVWLDSPRGNSDAGHPGPPCPANTGTFDLKNGGSINGTDDKNPAEFSLYVYGTTSDGPGNPDVDFNNNLQFYGTIYAPNSSIEVWNNQAVWGAFTAENIYLKNNGGFTYDNRIANQEIPGTASADNLSWLECKRDPTVETDPESGCG